jgi:hypothetical protein
MHYTQIALAIESNGDIMFEKIYIISVFTTLKLKKLNNLKITFSIKSNIVKETNSKT